MDDDGAASSTEQAHRAMRMIQRVVLALLLLAGGCRGPSEDAGARQDRSGAVERAAHRTDELETERFPLAHLERPHIYGSLRCQCDGRGHCRGFASRGDVVVKPTSPRFTRLWESLAAELQASGRSGASLEYDHETHALVVTGDAAWLRRIGRVIEAMDRPGASSQRDPHLRSR